MGVAKSATFTSTCVENHIENKLLTANGGSKLAGVRLQVGPLSTYN